MVERFLSLGARKGVSPRTARLEVRTARRRRERERARRRLAVRGMFPHAQARDEEADEAWRVGGDDDDGALDAAAARAAVEALRREAMEARAKMEEMRRARREVKSTGTSRAALESHRRREEAKTFDPRAASRRAYDGGRTTTAACDDNSGDVFDNDGQNGSHESFEAYEERWCAFERSDEAHVAARDIPWPRSGAWLLRALERALPSTDDPKRAHRALAKRWHPDKFIQRFGARIDAREREAIESRVKAVYQSAQELWDACSKR